MTLHAVRRGVGRPLLLIHGFECDHRLLLGLDEGIARRAGWQRTYLDLPGMGRSPAGPAIDGTDAVAAAVHDFVRAELGDEPFAVLGQSYGGAIARDIVARLGAQVVGLALLCPMVVADHDRRRAPPRVVLRTDPALLASLEPADAEAYAELAVVQSPAGWARFRDEILPGERAADRAAIARIAARYAFAVEPEERAPRYDGPALFIAARQDHVTGYEDVLDLLEHYPRATLAVLDRAGHNAHLEQPVLVAGLIDEWLARVEIEGASS